jgi:hypothetical protein
MFYGVKVVFLVLVHHTKKVCGMASLYEYDAMLVFVVTLRFQCTKVNSSLAVKI